MTERIISVEKEQKIQDFVEKEITTLSSTIDDIKELELKIAELVSKEMDGEPWICHVEKNSNNLEWYEKPQLYHINKQKQQQLKKLLAENEQAKGNEKLSVATPSFKIFLVKSHLQIDNEVKYLVQRYYDRLSKYSEKVKRDKESEKSSLDKLSYFEISVIAQYMDESQVQDFRRVSKVCNFASCYAIIRNIHNFQQLIYSDEYLKNQEYLKETLPKNIDTLINFSASFSSKDLNEYSLHLGNQYVKEALHLVLKLARPLGKKSKFDTTDFRRILLSQDYTTNQMINQVDYSLITSQQYREVVKRQKLWKVGQEPLPIKNQKFKDFINFISNTIEFLQIRENTELFYNMNGFYNLILKSIYLISLLHKEKILQNHINHIRNTNGGRIDGLMPSKVQVFKGVSLNVLSNLIGFFEIKDCFKKFRIINKKFNQSFDQFILLKALDIDKKLKGYSSAAIEEAKQEIKHNLTIINRINTNGQQINNISGEAKQPTEQKLYSALAILSEKWKDLQEKQFNHTGKYYNRVVVEHKKVEDTDDKKKKREQGMPKFKTKPDAFRHANFTNIGQVEPKMMQEFQKFVDFYGPNEDEINEYLRSNRIKEDIKITYLKDVLQYWNVDRLKLKERSSLHYLILQREEDSEVIEKLNIYLKKFKPNKLKEEGFT